MRNGQYKVSTVYFLYPYNIYSVLLSEVRQMVIYLGEYHITFRVFKKKGSFYDWWNVYFYPLKFKCTHHKLYFVICCHIISIYIQTSAYIYMNFNASINKWHINRIEYNNVINFSWIYQNLINGDRS